MTTSVAIQNAIKTAAATQLKINNSIKDGWGITLNLANYQDISGLYITIGDKAYLPKKPSEATNPATFAGINNAMPTPIGTTVLALKKEFTIKFWETQIKKLFVNTTTRAQSATLGHPDSAIAKQYNTNTRLQNIEFLLDNLNPLLKQLKKINWEDHST